MGCGSSFQLRPSSSWVIPQQLDQSITKRFMELDQRGKIQVEYVWMDSDYLDHEGMSFMLCSKALTIDEKPDSVEDLPIWNFGDDKSDVKLVPRKIYNDPFRAGDNILVLCDTYAEPEISSCHEYGPPTYWNTRADCAAVMQKTADVGDDPWFGIEQEYYLMDIAAKKPLGWPNTNSYPNKDEFFYCTVGATRVVGRDIVEAHYRACIFAGIKIGGINSEDEPSQWEYQVGPCPGIDGADELWMSRYILQRICEMYNVRVSFNPKPVAGRAGIGCHTNYSNKATRTAPGGMMAIEKQITHLRMRHDEHMAVYGKDNQLRMTGKNNAPTMSEFSWGIGDRSVSVRVNVKCKRNDCGFYEDRRPAANMDPYLVMHAIVKTTLFFEEPLSMNDRSHNVDEIKTPVTAWAEPKKITVD